VLEINLKRERSRRKLGRKKEKRPAYMCLELRTDHGSGEANKPELPSLIMTWQLIHGNTETEIQDYISEQKYK